DARQPDQEKRALHWTERFMAGVATSRRTRSLKSGRKPNFRKAMSILFWREVLIFAYVIWSRTKPDCWNVPTVCSVLVCGPRPPLPPKISLSASDVLQTPLESVCGYVKK